MDGPEQPNEERSPGFRPALPTSGGSRPKTFTLTTLSRPLGPALLRVCQSCFTAREPVAPRSCIFCRQVHCEHSAVYHGCSQEARRGLLMR